MDGYQKIKIVAFLLITVLVWGCQSRRPAGTYLYTEAEKNYSVAENDSSYYRTNKLVEADSISSEGYETKQKADSLRKNVSSKLEGKSDTSFSTYDESEKTKTNKAGNRKKDVDQAKEEFATSSQSRTDTVYIVEKEKIQNAVRNGDNDEEVEALRAQYKEDLKDLNEVVENLKDQLQQIEPKPGQAESQQTVTRVITRERTDGDRNYVSKAYKDSLYETQSELQRLKDSLSLLVNENEKLAARAYRQGLELQEQEDSSNLAMDTTIKVVGISDVSENQKDTIEQLRLTLARLKNQELVRTDTIKLYLPDTGQIQIRKQYEQQLEEKTERIKSLQKQIKEASVSNQVAPQAAVDTVSFTVYYETSVIEPDNFVKLKNRLQKIDTEKAEMILLSGHTDSSGDAERNLELSSKRMRFIENYIVEKGFNPRKIYKQNFGEKFASKEKIERERRVEVRIYLK
ncbi:MAG: OmpA family protein [Bacteroidales bacterium]|nr:OmpA family protein [Bacteroidales bacterium]MCF8326797.1 OmpA family protein [Bacteroidales bacterium]